MNLPPRKGSPPLVAGPRPHEQLNQNSPPEIQERLVALVSDLPGVEIGPSFMGMEGVRGFHLAPQLARGPVTAFQAGTEFGHIHPFFDGSLHLTLPGDAWAAAIAAGWAVPHPESAVLLVFGPRDEAELETVWILLYASYRYARGQED